MESISHYFKNHGPRLNLTRSRTRQIQIFVDISVPLRPEIKYRLSAIDHDVHLEFSRQTWLNIVQHKREIKNAAGKKIRVTRSNTEIDFILREIDLEVFVKIIRQSRAVCFKQGEQEIRKLLPTFHLMMHKRVLLEEHYEAMKRSVKTAACKVLKMNALSSKDPRFKKKTRIMRIIEQNLSELMDK